MPDAYGLPVTSTSSKAVSAFDSGVAGLLGWDRRTSDFFRLAIAEDPQLAIAHAGLAISLFVEERFDEARAAAQAARARLPGASTRERSAVEALALYVAVRMDEAERAMHAHVVSYPRDLLVAQRLYFLWFFQGRFEAMRDLTSTLVRNVEDNSFVLGMHAFAVEELGDCEQALRFAEASIAKNREDTWGVHALVHALYEMGASAEGLHRVPPAIAGCTNINYYRNHLLWHVVLMHLARGDYARASQMTRDVFEREPSPLALDLRNSISLLWRFELCGMDVKARWAPFVTIARRRLDRPEDLPFHHAHLAMALAGGGDWSTAERHLDVLRARGHGGARVLEEVVLPLVEGLHAFAAQRWRTVIDKLEPIRAQIIRIGGSRAQRDVFHDTLLEACFRAADVDRAERLLAERIARRSDHFWVNRRVHAV